jgi:hypothetical protein
LRGEDQRSENCGKRRRKSFAGSSTSTSLPPS